MRQLYHILSSAQHFATVNLGIWSSSPAPYLWRPAQRLRRRRPTEPGQAAPTIPSGTLSLMERYPWPGNVRELENAIQRAIALRGTSSQLAREHLLPIDDRWRGATEVSDEIRPLRELLKEGEGEHLRRALASTGGHRSQTAELLGISRKVLWEKLKDHGIDDGEG